MKNAYLELARRIINLERRPLRPKEIIQIAYANQHLPTHLYGPRQDKTLHARISEDILANEAKSIFYRTAPGVFALKSFLNDKTIPNAYKAIYRAPERRRELHREKILAIQTNQLLLPDQHTEIISIDVIDRILRTSQYNYIDMPKAKSFDDVAVVRSFVCILQDHQILSYRSARLSNDHFLLEKKRTIGFGKFVTPKDLDLLSDTYFGIKSSGLNEILYMLSVARDQIDGIFDSDQINIITSIASRDRRKGARILSIIMAINWNSRSLPHGDRVYARDLRWVSLQNPSNNLDDFDLVSRMILQAGLLLSTPE